MPQLEGRPAGDTAKIAVGCEHCQIMTNAKLGKQRVNGANLQSRTSTVVAQFGGRNVILPIWHQKRQCRKTFHNLRTRFGT